MLKYNHETHVLPHLNLSIVRYNYYYYTRLTASFPGQPGQAGTRKVKPAGIYTVSQKKTKLLPITSPNINRFSQFFR